MSELVIVFGGACIVAMVALLRSESRRNRRPERLTSRKHAGQAGGDCGTASGYAYIASDGGSTDCASADSGGGCDGGGGGGGD
jgi:hypothetical protein